MAWRTSDVELFVSVVACCLFLGFVLGLLLGRGGKRAPAPAPMPMPMPDIPEASLPAAPLLQPATALKGFKSFSFGISKSFRSMPSSGCSSSRRTATFGCDVEHGEGSLDRGEGSLGRPGATLAVVEEPELEAGPASHRHTPLAEAAPYLDALTGEPRAASSSATAAGLESQDSETAAPYLDRTLTSQVAALKEAAPDMPDNLDGTPTSHCSEDNEATPDLEDPPDVATSRAAVPYYAARQAGSALSSPQRPQQVPVPYLDSQ